MSGYWGDAISPKGENFGMGHERSGALPRSQQWREVVSSIAALQTEGQVSQVARATIHNVRKQFHLIHRDRGVIAAFGFLIALSRSSVSDHSQRPHVDLSSNPSPLRISIDLSKWIKAHLDSVEYADIAQKAATEVVGTWTRQQQQQSTIFPEYSNASEVWRKAGGARGFCEVARIFFAKFTERYLHFFLDREASAVLPGVEERDGFSNLIEEHVDAVSTHAFETSRITQSFAAGWYNNHARTRMPSNEEIEGFLRVAFGKIREELMRESVAK